MRKGIELQEADGHPLCKSSDYLGTEPYSLDADDCLGEAIRLTLVPNFAFANKWKQPPNLVILATEACKYTLLAQCQPIHLLRPNSWLRVLRDIECVPTDGDVEAMDQADLCPWVFSSIIGEPLLGNGKLSAVVRML